MPIQTGMGRVSEKLINVWEKTGNSIVALYWNHPGGSAPYPAFTIPGSKIQGLTDDVINFIFSKIAQYHPDCVVIQGDIFYFIGLDKLKSRLGIPIIGYYNLDSKNINPSFLQILNSTTDVVMSSAWAQAQLRTQLNFNRASYVHHGVDTSIFRPIPTIPKDNSIIFVGQNTVRKDIPSLLRAYAKAREMGLKNILKIYSNYSTGEYNLQLEAARLNILEFVKFYNENINDLMLVQAYNSADFFVTASGGEGFCLPVLEAMACGIPVVAPANTSFKELVENRGKLAWTVDNINSMGVYGMELSKVDIDSLANQMCLLADELNDDKNRKKYFEECVDFAKEHTWEKTANFLLARYRDIFMKAQSIDVIDFSPVDPLIFYITKKSNARIAVVKSGNTGDFVQLIPVLKGIQRKYNTKPDIFGTFGTECLKPFASHCFNSNMDPRIILASIRSHYEYIYFYVTYYATIFRNGEIIKQSEVLPAVQSNLKLNVDFVTCLIQSSDLTDYCSPEDLTYNDVELDLPQIKEKEKDYIMLALDGYLPVSKNLPPEYIIELISKLKKLQIPIVSTRLNFDLPVARIIDQNDTFTEMAYAKNARLIVSIDNRFLWFAQAFNVPAIVLFGPTNPATIIPRNNILLMYQRNCDPCWFMYTPCIYQKRLCVNYPEVDKIVEQIYNFLKGGLESYGA